MHNRERSNRDQRFQLVRHQQSRRSRYQRELRSFEAELPRTAVGAVRQGLVPGELSGELHRACWVEHLGSWRG